METVSARDVANAEFVFPRVLARLDYARQFAEHDHRPVVCRCLDTLRWYSRDMVDGMRYQRYIADGSAASMPNCITDLDLSNVRHIKAQGFSHEDVRDLIGTKLDALSEIPQDGDLFVTDRFDRLIEDSILEISGRYRGLRLANATKLLHQKRPALIPIFDQYARQALAIYWIGNYAPKDTRAVVRLGLERIRTVASQTENWASLMLTHDWSRSPDSEYADLAVTKLRTVDILAWSVDRAVH